MKIILILLLIATLNLFAMERDSIKKDIDSSITNIILSLNGDKNKDSIVENLNPIFNFSLISKLAIDKKMWKSLTKEQRSTYQKSFKRMITTFYYKKFLKYTDEKINVLSIQDTKKNRIIVRAELVGDSKYSLIFKVYGSKVGWSIYDVEIEGVSVLKTFKKQMKLLFKNNSFEESIIILQKKGDI